MEEEKNENLEENNNEVVAEEIEENEGIEISGDVIAVIAGVAVSEVQGVASMSGGFAGGITEVLSGKKNLAKGIKVDKTDVAFEIQNRVKKSVENMTGLKVEEVNVHVQGVNTDSVVKNEETQTEQKESENE